MFPSIFCSVSGLLLCRPLEMQDFDFAACFSLLYSRCRCRDSSGAYRCCSHLSTSQPGCLICFFFLHLKKPQQFKSQPKPNQILSSSPHGLSSFLLMPSLQQCAATVFNEFTSRGHYCIQQRRNEPCYSVLHTTDYIWKTVNKHKCPESSGFLSSS